MMKMDVEMPPHAPGAEKRRASPPAAGIEIFTASTGGAA